MLVWIFLISPWLALLGLIIWDTFDKRSFSDPMIMLTGVPALCTAASCVVAFLQWRVLEQTDNTFWAGQRPWLGVRPKIELVDLSIDHSPNEPQWVQVDVKFSVNNYGNIPATDTKLISKIFIDPIEEQNAKLSTLYNRHVAFDNSLMASQKELCAGRELFAEDKAASLSSTVFRGEIEQTGEASIFP